jgi:hypothetical protein
MPTLSLEIHRQRPDDDSADVVRTPGYHEGRRNRRRSMPV